MYQPAVSESTSCMSNSERDPCPTICHVLAALLQARAWVARALWQLIALPVVCTTLILV